MMKKNIFFLLFFIFVFSIFLQKILALIMDIVLQKISIAYLISKDFKQRYV